MLLTLLMVVLSSCSLFDQGDNGTDNDFFIARYDMNNLPEVTTYEQPEETGIIYNEEIKEISGMVVSRQDENFFWVHNDSGDWNRIFLVHRNGKWRGTFMLKGVLNRDWEDIAIGPGPVDGINYIYIAETGDNSHKYDQKFIFRFPEPDITTADTTIHYVEVTNVETLTFVYPEGVKMDAETLMIDPWTKDLYIVTKREVPATVYRLPYPQSTTQTIVADKYGTIPFTFTTAGDISADGKQIIVKTYEKVFLWTRNEGESMADAFMRQPIRVPYIPEPQGEAIAFPFSADGYYTTSEIRLNVIPRIYFYKKK